MIALVPCGIFLGLIPYFLGEFAPGRGCRELSLDIFGFLGWTNSCYYNRIDIVYAYAGFAFLGSLLGYPLFRAVVGAFRTVLQKT